MKPLIAYSYLQNLEEIACPSHYFLLRKNILSLTNGTLSACSLTWCLLLQLNPCFSFYEIRSTTPQLSSKIGVVPTTFCKVRSNTLKLSTKLGAVHQGKGFWLAHPSQQLKLFPYFIFYLNPSVETSTYYGITDRIPSNQLQDLIILHQLSQTHGCLCRRLQLKTSFLQKVAYRSTMK